MRKILSFPLLALLASACSSGADSGESDLTSVTATERKLSFEGYVYVDEGASAKRILAAVKTQTQSAFGALRNANISVADRELADVDPSLFKKESVTVVSEGGDRTPALRVRYQFKDQAVVPNSMSQTSTVAAGLLSGDQTANQDRILVECTTNGEEDHEFADALWYVFYPTLPQCQTAMKTEQDEIDAARANLENPAEEISENEFNRLYLPIAVSLAPAEDQPQKAFPEYDKLWRGGIEKDKINIMLMFGEIEHYEGHSIEKIPDDGGYFENMGALDAILTERPNMKVVSTKPAVDLTTFEVAGKTVTAKSFQDIVNWEYYAEYPEGIESEADKKALLVEAAKRLYRTNVRFEEKVMVSIGGDAPVEKTIVIDSFFGAGDSVSEYKRAIKSHDVFIYNGHSSIGYGPLDPSNFTSSDFPSSYQIFFIDSCVSFNYYNKDYFKLKGGTANLDTITNGMESSTDGAGAGNGRFILGLTGLTSTEPFSYKELLEEASSEGEAYDWGHDALRLVDGEIGNEYSPHTTPITVETIDN